MRESLKSIIDRWVKKEPKLALTSYTDLAKKMIAEEGLPYSREYLRQEIGRVVRLPQVNAELKQIVEEPTATKSEEKKTYAAGDTMQEELDEEEKIDILEDSYNRKFLVSPDKKRYLIEVKGKATYFSIEFIDKLFIYYSEHGYNYTGTQVMNEFDLTPQVWHSICRSFALYKKSHIFSPYTWDNTPPEKREEMVEEAIQKAISSGKVTERVYRKTLYSKYKREIKKSHLVTANHNEFLLELAELLPKAKAETVIQYTAPYIITQREEILAAVADLHTGAFIMNLPSMPNFSLDILRKRLSEAAYYINSLNARRVKLALLGDYIESFTGLNHPNSWQGMETGLFGANVVTAAYEVILEFAEQIKNLVEIAGVGGNHDRSTKSGKEDSRAEIANILFYFIGAHLTKAGVTVKYDNDTVSTTLGDKLRPILQHGHNGNSRGPVTNILWDHGLKGLFNFILQGHYHSRQTKNNDDGQDFRRITCASIFTGNDYSKKAGFAPSLAGITVLEQDSKGLPYIHDKALN
jgi:hypothetical protein